MPSHVNKVNEVLIDISFGLEEEEIVGLRGVNGSGKSTILRIISGIISQDSGEIIYKDLTKDKIALINSNERSFYWRLTAYQNLKFFGSLYGLKKKELDTKIDNLVEEFKLEKLIQKEFMFLSSGQRKRLLIARSLLKDPKLLLCDEITSNLDQPSKKEIMEIIQKVVRKNKTSVLWVSHEKEELSSFCERELRLENGKVG
jgi:ABC-type multidrug transport system, ATPase component